MVCFLINFLIITFINISSRNKYYLKAFTCINNGMSFKSQQSLQSTHGDLWWSQTAANSLHLQAMKAIKDSRQLPGKETLCEHGTWTRIVNLNNTSFTVSTATKIVQYFYCLHYNDVQACRFSSVCIYSARENGQTWMDTSSIIHILNNNN